MTIRSVEARLLLVVSLLSGGVVSACGSPTPTDQPNASAASPSGSAGEPTPTVSLPAQPSAVAPSSAPPSNAVPVDPGLLEVLPTAVDGVALEADPTTAAQVAGDPLLAEASTGIAVALAVGPGASDTEDLAVASVIRLRPDVFDEAFYQEWRDTYDEAACEVADGVESVAEMEIGGRQVHVGTCTGGAMTYHTYLEDQQFIVSITATGPRRFGELLMAGLAS